METVQIVVKGKIIAANRLALINSSDYFKAMFESSFAEAEQSCIELKSQELCPESVDILVRRAKKIDKHINRDNVYDLHQASLMLQFQEAIEECENFLHRGLRSKILNMFDVFLHADIHSLRQLKRNALKLILFTADSILDGNAVKLSEPLMIEIVGNRHLNVSSEGNVVTAIEKWMSYHGVQWRDNRAMAQCIRFNDLDDEEFRSRSKSLDWIHQTSTREVPLKPCVIGRNRKFVKDKPTIYAFRENRVETLSEVKYFLALDEGHSEYGYTDEPRGNVKGFQAVSCPERRFVYFVGGEFDLGRSKWNRHVATFDALFNAWVDGPLMELPNVRRHHGLVVWGNKYLILVGGFGKHRIMLNSVESIDTETGVASDLPDLPMALYSPAVCIFKGELFVIQRHVYRLKSLATRDWDNLGSLDNKDNIFINYALATSDHIYLVSKNAYVLVRFDPPAKETNKIALDLMGKFHREVQNVVLMDNKIFNFSSEQFDTESCVEYFDIETGEFKLLTSMDNQSFDFSPYYSFGCFPLIDIV